MKTLLTGLLFLVFSSVLEAQTSISKADFQSPPQSTKVNTWWHWISGNITKDGITKDLESMKQQGIVQATILNVGGLNSLNAEVPSIKFNSPQWFEMFQWALKEASRLDIKIGIHNCDGWSTSGGPWITPELSMKQFVWSKTSLEGGQEINTKISEPIGLNNFYRDVALLAYPMEEKTNSFQQAQPIIQINKASVGTILADGNPKSEINIKKGDVVTIRLASDFTANKLVLFPHVIFSWDDMSKIKSQFTISSSNDGKVYSKIASLEFKGVNQSIAAIFPSTKAKYFQIECIDGHYPIAELEMLKDDELPAYSPQVSYLLEKAASVNALNERAFESTAKNNSRGIAENSIIDLSGQMSSEGMLKWKAPKGHWQIIRFGYTTTGVKNGPATPEGTGLEADKMDTAALNFHFNSFAAKLIQSAGAYKGNTFKFLLIDSWECQYQTWTKAFPEEFKQRRGYSMTHWIPVLCDQTIETTQLSEAFLHDFRKTISDLIDQNYYRHFSELCHQNQLEMHAEVIYANSGPYPPFDALKSNRYLDLPMTEFWANPNKDQFPQYDPAQRPTAGFPTYASLACNKPVIGSEAYTGYAHYSESPSDLKPFGDAAYCSGINQMILHSYVHQPTDQKPGITLGQFAAHFNRNNPWWEYAQDWMTYQARIQYVLQKGEPVVDVIFYIGDQLPQYFSKSILNDLPYGIQASVCNFDMLKDEAKVIDGKISFGGKQSFPLLALPKSQVMEFATLQRIAQLVNDGAVVYGPKPTEMMSVSEIKTSGAAFHQLADQLWSPSGESKYGKGKVISGKPIAEVLKQLGVLPDLTTNTANPLEIMFIHKTMKDGEVYYVFNQQDRAINREILFRVKDQRPEIWNPEIGSVLKPAVYSVEKNQIRIPLSFNPHESKMIVFKKGVSTPFIQNVSMAGKQIFPQQQLTDTNLVLPQAVFRKGKFGFTSSLTGDYSYTTNENKIVKAHLVQPIIMDIRNFKARIEFFPISNEMIQPVEISELKSLTEFDNPAIQYFAGKAKYTIGFHVDDQFIVASDSMVLNLGQMDATAEVLLNGKLLAYTWMPNASLVVTGLLKAENKLEITVATVCRNRFLGDLRTFGTVKSLWTTSPISTILNKDMPLKPSGLMGPLKLTGYVRQID
ncbi:MAG TPA: glycosyl hydrolase [Prolixibacteraceae bacterium]|jgi:hypothetical protein